MLGKLFKTKEVDEFADSLVADLVKRLPPSGLSMPAKKAVERLRKTHDVVFRRIETFARAQTLGIYRKARLGNRVKWALVDAGYPSDFVETLTIELVTVVTLVSRERKRAVS